MRRCLRRRAAGRGEGSGAADRAAVVAVAAATLLAGCVAVDPEPRFAELRSLVRSPVGEPVVWQRTPADTERAHALVEDLLADGLSREDAVRIALLANPGVQASFEEIGIAEAHNVQAGLLQNPSFDVVLLFPLDIGDSSAALLGYLSDLWTVPVEQAVAEHATEATLRRVAAAVVAAAADTADAYDQVLRWTARCEIEAGLLELERARVARLRASEAGPDPDTLFAAEGDALEQDLALAAAEKERTTARARLSALLALPADRPLPRLTDALATPPRRTTEAAEAVEFALANRFDVAAAALGLAGAADALELEHRRVGGEVMVGPAYNGGFGDFDTGGGALGLTLPVFDQNQAQIARAEHELRRQERKLAEIRLRARTEVVEAVAEVELGRRRADAAASRAERAAELARAARRRAAADPGGAVTAESTALTARRAHVEAVAGLRAAETELHRALWGAARTSSPGGS